MLPRFKFADIAFTDPSLNAPVAPKKSSRVANRANFLTFMNLRQDFRNAFASRVLRPVDLAPRIEAMVTAATRAIFEDKKKRYIYSIMGELFMEGRIKPFSTAEALAFIWVYVGTAEAVARRSGLIDPHYLLDSQLGYLFKRAVSHDKEKNMPHVAHLWRKLRRCHLPSAEFCCHERILRGIYGGVDLDKLPAPEAGMDQLFQEMSSLYGDNVEENTAFLKKKLRHKLRQKVSQQLDKDLTPGEIMKPSSSTFGSVNSPEIVGELNSKTIGNMKPENVEMTSPDFVHEPSNNNDSDLPLKTTDNESLLFLTNPGKYIEMNPSLFPSSKDNVNWSARKLLPDPPTKRKKANQVDDPVPEQEVAQTPADCTETLLRVDFTPEEYIDHTTASNYYAQGVKIVDGVRRVVFYHKIINLSGIKEEPI
ncbi:uncharacterized protein LOC118437356 [Folsomia candida]|uniref:Uncharacterized protein n=1 Tax=Folsomia candida TaxID=158441 RepID=A0A226DRD0_FOLCA|nr:uncharacterized protein LOC118437356 [Folsomia candida]XP_035712201.1 uncharacterized protein LOC118437356 [Folsomia candida]OXA47251.1 hypothetical protein Fcan01_18031 [Folsomia candida]